MVWATLLVVAMVGVSLFIVAPSLFSSPPRRTVSVRFVRPLSLGTEADIHHLHLSEVQVFAKDGRALPLACASPCTNAMGAEEGNGPENAFDGDLATTYHNKWVGQYEEATPFYGTETHFLHLTIGDVADAAQVGRIVVHHAHPQKRRVVGARVELLEGESVVWSDIFSEERDEYVFDV